MRVSTLLGYLDALGLNARIVVDVPRPGEVDVTALVAIPPASLASWEGGVFRARAASGLGIRGQRS